MWFDLLEMGGGGVNNVLKFIWKGALKFVTHTVNLKKSNFRCLFRVSIYKKTINGFVLRNWWENKKNIKLCMLHIVLQIASNLESCGLFVVSHFTLFWALYPVKKLRLFVRVFREAKAIIFVVSGLFSTLLSVSSSSFSSKSFYTELHFFYCCWYWTRSFSLLLHLNLCWPKQTRVCFKLAVALNSGNGYCNCLLPVYFLVSLVGSFIWSR
jgi:hypothetical protein